MQIQNETPILSCILWKIFKALYSTQLFKIRTLSYRDNVTGHTLVTLGKGREVPELCSREAECSRARSHVSRIVLAFWREKAHGMPFEAIPLAPSHAVWSEKGSRVATFLAKKEGVWRDLSEKRCRLADFRRKRKRCGATSMPFSTTRRKRKVGGTTSAGKSADSRIFGNKGNRVAQPQNLPNILYFFVYQHRLNDPHGGCQ